MLDIIMDFWEPSLSCRGFWWKVIVTAGYCCGSSKNDKIFMRWCQQKHQSLVL